MKALIMMVAMVIFAVALYKHGTGNTTEAFLIYLVAAAIAVVGVGFGDLSH